MDFSLVEEPNKQWFHESKTFNQWQEQKSSKWTLWNILEAPSHSDVTDKNLLGRGGVRGGGGVSLFTCTAEQQDFALRRILWPTDCDRHHESHLTLVLSAENRFHLSLPHENITGFIGYCYPHSKSPTLSAFVQIAEGCKLYSDQQNCRVTTKYYVCLSQWWIKIKVLAEPPVKSY